METWNSTLLRLSRIFVTFLIFVQTNSELRFCHHGPQKVDSKECPSGILFKTPITSKCVFYAPDGSSLPPSYSKDTCSPQTTPVSPKKKMETTVIQKIEFAGDKTTEEGKFSPPTFDPINDPSCIQECFDNVDPWDLYKSDEELPEYSFAAATCPDEILEQQLNISEALFDYLLFGQDTEAKLPNNRLHQLLELCSLILLKHCGGPYIKPIFLIQSLEALKFLHFTVNKAKILEIPAQSFASIEDRLNQCLQKPQARLKVSGLQCSTKAKIENVEYVSRLGETRRLKYRLEPKSYRFGKLDIFIEAAWAALDFAHSFCFEEFRNFPYEIDMLAEHVGRIFAVKEIAERWYCPVELKNPSFWNNLAGVGDVKWTMRNIDFCSQAAAKISVFGYRMERTFETETDTHDSILLGPSAEKKGWTGTEEAYWKEYQKLGGIRTFLMESNEGVCAADPQEMAIFKEQHSAPC